MMAYNAKDIFDTASSFTAANQIVIEKLSQTDDVGTLIAPIVTLSSFSIELYMKCIYMIENEKPAPNRHELDKLFHLLSEESQIVIRMFYDMYVQMDPLVKVLLEKVPDTKVDLDSMLKEISVAFVKWRYSYEKKFTGFPTAGPLINALRGRIQVLKQDWFQDQA